MTSPLTDSSVGPSLPKAAEKAVTWPGCDPLVCLPQMIRRRAYSRKVDVYSFGILCWEMFTAETAFAGMSGVQAAFAVVSKVSKAPTTPPTAAQGCYPGASSLQVPGKPLRSQDESVVETSGRRGILLDQRPWQSGPAGRSRAR
jgi:serine/threonine protein kinase